MSNDAPPQAAPSRGVTIRRHSITAALACAAIAYGSAAATVHAGDRADLQYTQLVSRNLAGDVPNGPSGNAVISNDKRFARVIAFESDASDLVSGDVNGYRDVFAARRGGTFGASGSAWVHGDTVLVSRTHNGEPANGPSFAPSVDGAFQDAETREPSCVAYLSAASNLVPGDTNGRIDAFVAGIERGAPRRVSAEVGADTTAVAASGDCSLIATVTGGALYLHDGGVTRLIATDGPASDPSFGVGRNQDLVFATPSGAWLLREGASAPRLVAPGGRNPAYNDVKRQVVAYEKDSGGHSQVFQRDLGEPERLVSGRSGVFGNGPSRDPVLGNSGYSLTFETDAANLGVNALRRAGDNNGVTDVYLYTDVRRLTLVQSVQEKAVPLPAGGRNASMSFYNNYITFDSPAPLGAREGPSQVFMRYLGPVSVGDGGSDIDSLPAPEVGKTANVGLVSGTVYVKLPAGASKAKYGFGAAQSNGFVRLTNANQIPLGSTMDTRRGRVELRTATSITKPGATQSAQFYAGMFLVRQVGGRRRPMTEAVMNGEMQCRSSRGKLEPAGRRRARSRRLWGNGRGRFRTRGRNSSATVRGTIWLQKDTCTRTTTSVRRGTVIVRDFAKRRNVRVKAPKRYTARARRR